MMHESVLWYVGDSLHHCIKIAAQTCNKVSLQLGIVNPAEVNHTRTGTKGLVKRESQGFNGGYHLIERFQLPSNNYVGSDRSITTCNSSYRNGTIMSVR
jgi:hypothetical protein